MQTSTITINLDADETAKVGAIRFGSQDDAFCVSLGPVDFYGTKAQLNSMLLDALDKLVDARVL